MKIGLIVTDLSNTRIGGISRVATEVGRNLVELGHEVTAYVLQREGDNSVSEFAGIQLRYIRPFKSINPDYPVVGFSRRAFQKVLEELDRERFDVIQTFNLNGIGLSKFHREFKKCCVPVVLSCYETIGMDVQAKSREFRSLPSVKTLVQILGESYLMLCYEKRYLKLADAIITEDENTRAALSRMNISTDKVHLVPSGVDVEEARETEPPPIDATWRRADPIIGYIGRIDPRKGVQYLIEAMPTVRKQFPNAQLVLAGGSRHGYNEIIQGLIERLDLNDAVHLLGRIKGDILPYYKLMDRVVIPSLSEGIPITLGEAMASEVPVIITKLPGVVPFVKPADLVHWAELGSAESLAQGILDSLTNPAPDQTRRALEFIRQYTWRAVAERHADVYRLQVDRMRATQPS